MIKTDVDFELAMHELHGLVRTAWIATQKAGEGTEGLDPPDCDAVSIALGVAMARCREIEKLTGLDSED
jgi:hypothetical protein